MPRGSRSPNEGDEKRGKGECTEFRPPQEAVYYCGAPLGFGTVKVGTGGGRPSASATVSVASAPSRSSSTMGCTGDEGMLPTREAFEALREWVLWPPAEDCRICPDALPCGPVSVPCLQIGNPLTHVALHERIRLVRVRVHRDALKVERGG